MNEIAHNRTLAKSGYDLSNELAAAVDLVSRAKSESPDIYKEGMPVSPYGRQAGLFDDEYGDSRVTDGVTLLLADLLNSGKPSDLRKVLSAYNQMAASPASGQLDMFSGEITPKEQILNDTLEHFRNATPREQQVLVDAAIAERKRKAEAAAAEPSGRGEASEQTENAVGGSEEPQQPAVTETTPAKQEEPKAEQPLSAQIKDASADVNTEPTEAQKEAATTRKAMCRWVRSTSPSSSPRAAYAVAQMPTASSGKARCTTPTATFVARRAWTATTSTYSSPTTLTAGTDARCLS